MVRFVVMSFEAVFYIRHFREVFADYGNLRKKWGFSLDVSQSEAAETSGIAGQVRYEWA